MSRIAVYTVIVGGYDTLRRPKVTDPNCDYYCITDNEILLTEFWRVIRLENDEHLDNTRLSRKPKILPHQYFPDYEESIYIDPNMELRSSLNEYVSRYTTGRPMLCMKHSGRDCIYQEAEECIRLAKDDAEVIERQIQLFREASYPEHYGLTQNSVIYRCHSDEVVIRLMEDWWEFVRTGSGRDQLSFNYVCWKNSFKYDVAYENWLDTKYFRRYPHHNEAFHYPGEAIGKVYFDNGSGFRESCSEKAKARLVNMEQNRLYRDSSKPLPLTYRFEDNFIYPPGTTRIRIDPIEGYVCILTDFNIYVGDTRLSALSHNGKEVDEYWYFENFDPQICIDIPEGHNSIINVSYDIYVFYYLDDWRLVSKAVQVESGRKEIEKISASKEAEFRDRLVELDSVIEKLASEKDAALEKLAIEKDSALERLASEKDALERLASEKDAALEKLASEKDSALEKLASEKDSALERLTSEKDAALEKLATEKDSALERLTSEKDAALEKLASEKDSALERLASKKDAALEKLASEKDALERLASEKDSALERLASEKVELALLYDEMEAKLVLLKKEKEAEKATSIDTMELLSSTIQELNSLNLKSKNQLDKLFKQLSDAEYAYAVVSNAFFWKITKPARVLLDALKRIPVFRIFINGSKCLKENGFNYTLKRLKVKIADTRTTSIFNASENSGFALPQLSANERSLQIHTVFKRNVKFSIVVPLYNTPVNFLTDLLDSVEKQTYQNWELCLADGSLNKKDIARIIHTRKANNKRVKYICLDTNRGIAGNTQAAFELATGDFIVLMDHDDLLTEDALFETAKCIEAEPDVDFVYSDRGIFDDSTKRLLAYHYLPAYSPEFLRACNYASHINVFSMHIIQEVGFMRSGYDGSQDYDLELRTVEKARKIINIEKVLYFCRACEGSVALNPESKMYAYEAGRKAIKEHIHRIGYPGDVEILPKTFSYRIRYDIIWPGKTTIIIPNKDHAEVLKKCIDSILTTPCQSPYEIVIVENCSTEPETFLYYATLKENPKIRVLTYESNGEFNYSAINNYAVEKTDGAYIVFLNNDIEVISENWLTEMLMFAQREDVGAVGAKLYYPNDTFQHIGLFIGLGGHIASHYDHKKSRFETGYMHRLTMPQNYNAVTAACLMIKRKDFLAVEGFDVVNFKVSLNDIDLCLKLREQGKLNVLTPYAELYHHESLTRNSDETGFNKVRFEKEQKMFRCKWKKYFDSHDIYCNPRICH